MKHVNCPVCGGHTICPVLIVRDRLYEIGGEVTLVRCQECGLFYLNPQPSTDDNKPHYPISYEPHQDYVIVERDGLRRQLRDTVLHKYRGYPLVAGRQGWRGRIISLAAPFFKSRVAGTPPFQAGRPNRILDVGSGNGRYLSMLRTLGWEVYGVEPNVQACKIGRAKGLDIHCGNLVSAQFPSGFFDYVRYAHVLEHIPDPCAELMEARRVLKDDGILFISVPVFDTLPAKIFKGDLFSIEAPRHLALYTLRSLRSLLDTCSFDIRRIRHCYGTNAFVPSLCYVYETISERRVSTRQKMRCINATNLSTVDSVGTMVLFLLHKLSAPLCWVLRNIGQGDSLEVECLKVE